MSSASFSTCAATFSGFGSPTTIQIDDSSDYSIPESEDAYITNYHEPEISADDVVVDSTRFKIPVGLSESQGETVVLDAPVHTQEVEHSAENHLSDPEFCLPSEDPDGPPRPANPSKPDPFTENITNLFLEQVLDDSKKDDAARTEEILRNYFQKQSQLLQALQKLTMLSKHVDDQVQEAEKFVREVSEAKSPDPQITFFSRNENTWTISLFEARRRSTLLASRQDNYFGYKKIMNRNPEFQARKAFEKEYPLLWVPKTWSAKEDEALMELTRAENMRILIAELCDVSERKLRSALNAENDARLMAEFRTQMLRIQNLPNKELEKNVHGINWEYISENGIKKFTAKECEHRFLELKHPLLLGKVVWDPAEDDVLHQHALQHGQHNWPLIADRVNQFNKERDRIHLRRAPDCLGRYMKITRSSRSWNAEEDERLQRAVVLLGVGNWALIAGFFDERTPQQCLFRWRVKIAAQNFNRGRWSDEEDKRLVLACKAFPPDTNLVTSYGYIRKKPKFFWADISKVVKTRTDASCRERYTCSLSMGFKFGKWSPEEDEKLEEAVTKCGNGRWAAIAAELGNRTDSQCARRWRVLQAHAADQEADDERDEEDDSDDLSNDRQHVRAILRRRAASRRRRRQSDSDDSSSDSSSSSSSSDRSIDYTLLPDADETENRPARQKPSGRKPGLKKTPKNKSEDSSGGEDSEESLDSPDDRGDDGEVVVRSVKGKRPNPADNDFELERDFGFDIAGRTRSKRQKLIDLVDEAGLPVEQIVPSIEIPKSSGDEREPSIIEEVRTSAEKSNKQKTAPSAKKRRIYRVIDSRSGEEISHTAAREDQKRATAENNETSHPTKTEAQPHPARSEAIDMEMSPSQVKVAASVTAASAPERQTRSTSALDVSATRATNDGVQPIKKGRGRPRKSLEPNNEASNGSASKEASVATLGEAESLSLPALITPVKPRVPTRVGKTTTVGPITVDSSPSQSDSDYDIPVTPAKMGITPPRVKTATKETKKRKGSPVDQVKDSSSSESTGTKITHSPRKKAKTQEWISTYLLPKRTAHKQALGKMRRLVKK